MRGLAINRFSGHGIELNTRGGNIIAGSRIGTDLNGNIQAGVDYGNRLSGVFINNVPDNTIGGTATTGADLNVISLNNRHGIEISGGGARRNLMVANLIGTNRSGSGQNQGNGSNGILIQNAPFNMIGTVTAGNIISGNNGHGISITGSGAFQNTVQNVLIGLEAGAGSIGNRLNGIFIQSASNIIGSTTAGVRTAISGNGGNGVRLDGPGALDNKIIGTFIGTGRDGTGTFPNAGHGVLISGGSRNRIGGNGAGNANIIANNRGDGVAVTAGGIRNQIRLNSIFANGGAGGLGIDLGPDGPTPNDTTDGDSGANNLQNFSELSTFTTNGRTDIHATLRSTPNTSFAFDFYANSTTPAQGQTYLGGKTAMTDSSGLAVVVFEAGAIPSGQQITATATDALGNTSEFSQGSTPQSNQAPQNVSIFPDNASDPPNTARLFTAVYADPNGARDIRYAYFQVRRGINGLRAFYNAGTNRLYLFADDGVTPLGGFAPGYSGPGHVIQNSQGSLNTQFTTVQTSETDRTRLIIQWSVTAKPSYVSTWPLSLFVQDFGGLRDGFDALGTWTIGSNPPEPGQANATQAKTAPVALSSAAARATGSRVVLSFTGALDAATAGDTGHYDVTVNEQSTMVESATYDASTNSVTLNLPENLLEVGDKVEVAWQELQDSQGRAVTGSTTVAAR